jgi:multidrug efflux pump
MALFVIPIIYILMDRLCRRLTGKSSAHGLIQAAAIDRETRETANANAAEHSHA